MLIASSDSNRLPAHKANYLVGAIDLNRPAGSGEPPLPIMPDFGSKQRDDAVAVRCYPHPYVGATLQSHGPKIKIAV